MIIRCVLRLQERSPGVSCRDQQYSPAHSRPALVSERCPLLSTGYVRNDDDGGVGDDYDDDVDIDYYVDDDDDMMMMI